MGCTPVTNLPCWDCLPEIDGALVRVSDNETIEGLCEAINQAERDWDLDRAMYFAESARKFYDYRASGARLSGAIQAQQHRKTR
jgi:hypothetical protein